MQTRAAHLPGASGLLVSERGFDLIILIVAKWLFEDLDVTALFDINYG